MTDPTGRTRAVAVIGTGVIGRTWIRVFARAGYETRVWDPDPVQVETAWEWMKADLKRARREHGLRKRVARSEREQVVRCESLEEALKDVIWIQESGPERLDEKRAAFVQLDKLAPARAVLATSASSLDMTAIAKGLHGGPRCLIASPLNPAHIIPIVEVVGGDRTDHLVLRRAVRFLERVGQTPVLLRTFVPGLLLGRLQAALMREALHLVAQDVAPPEAIDAVVRDGLGLRWALLGPFAVAHTNGEGGIREFFQHYGDAWQKLSTDLCTKLELTPEVVDRIARSVDATWRRVPRNAQRVWRDDMVLRIRDLKQAHPVVPPELDD